MIQKKLLEGGGEAQWGGPAMGARGGARHFSERACCFIFHSYRKTDVVSSFIVIVVHVQCERGESRPIDTFTRLTMEKMIELTF